MKHAGSSFRLTPRWQIVLLLMASCSFQNFDYLKEGAGSGGSGGAGGAATTGGSSEPTAGTDSLGEGGTGEMPGGSSGGPSEAGKAGSGGSGGGAGGTTSVTEGGVGGEAGDGSGNTGNTGAVGQLVNPSFETATTIGWSVTPSQALTKRYIFVQLPQGTATVPDGNYELSTWHLEDAFSLEIFQTITGLEDGTYTFKGYFSRGDGFNSVTMFARDCGGADVEPVPVPVTDPSQWLNVELMDIEVVGGSCLVGLAIDSNATNWLNADFFSFEKQEEEEE